MITLTPEERRRFAEYLRQEAATNRQLAAQAKKLGGIGASIAATQESEASAFEYVARKLDSWESQTIKG